MSIKGLGLAILILAVAAVLAGCSSFAGSQGEEATRSSNTAPISGSPLRGPINGLVQSNSGGAVTIDVEWLGERSGSLAFDVAMNTHSVDLDQYDLGELAVLRDDEGNQYRPTLWRSGPGGHHRKGTLTFPLPDSLGSGKAKYLEMVIRGVAGVKERVLRWELG